MTDHARSIARPGRLARSGIWIRAAVGVLLVPLLALSVTAPGAAAPAAAGPLAWVGAGTFHKVYDTSNENPSRYINDHAVIKGPDGTWHMFGITGDEAPPGTPPDSSKEDTFAHATAPSLNGPWTTQPPVLTVDPAYGEDHLWAPYVLENDGTYYMFYSGGGGDTGAAINLATSKDLYTWTRLPSGTLFRDGWVARDPMVVRDGDHWIMYYCATSAPDGGNHVVAYRTSTDLVHWGDRHIAYTDPTTTSNSAPVTESPFVVERDGWWYLFIGPRGGGYTGTDVFRSQDPEHFEVSGYAGHVPAHAAEVVQDGGQWWVTHAGWFQDGLHIAPLHWRATPPPWQSADNPAVARDQDGRLEAFAVTADGTGLLHRSQTAPNGPWTDWEPFGDAAGAVPTVGTDADGSLELFALDAAGTGLLHRKQTSPSGPWGPWEDFGTAGAAPAVGRNQDGRLEIFAVTPGGTGIVHRWQTAANGGWSDWESFGGPTGGPPVVAANADGRLEVFAVGPANDYLSHRYQTAANGGWSDWESFGGPASGPPVVAANADGRLEVFALEPYGGGISHRWQTQPSGGWSDWADFGTYAGAAPTVARNADGRLEVFAIGPGDDYVSHRWQTQPSGGWSDWESFGGPAQCTPSPAVEADGRISVFALHPEGGGISQRTQTAPSGGWQDWGVFSGAVGGTACGSAS